MKLGLFGVNVGAGTRHTEPARPPSWQRSWDWSRCGRSITS